MEKKQENWTDGEPDIKNAFSDSSSEDEEGYVPHKSDDEKCQCSECTAIKKSTGEKHKKGSSKGSKGSKKSVVKGSSLEDPFLMGCNNFSSTKSKNIYGFNSDNIECENCENVSIFGIKPPSGKIAHFQDYKDQAIFPGMRARDFIVVGKELHGSEKSSVSGGLKVDNLRVTKKLTTSLSAVTIINDKDGKPARHYVRNNFSYEMVYVYPQKSDIQIVLHPFRDGETITIKDISELFPGQKNNSTIISLENSDSVVMKANFKNFKLGRGGMVKFVYHEKNPDLGFGDNYWILLEEYIPRQEFNQPDSGKSREKKN